MIRYENEAKVTGEEEGLLGKVLPYWTFVPFPGYRGRINRKEPDSGDLGIA